MNIKNVSFKKFAKNIKKIIKKPSNLIKKSNNQSNKLKA